MKATCAFKFRAVRQSPRRECSFALHPARLDAGTGPSLPPAARRHPCRRLPSPSRTGSRWTPGRRRRPCSCWGSRYGDGRPLIDARRGSFRLWSDSCPAARRCCDHRTRPETANKQRNKQWLEWIIIRTYCVQELGYEGPMKLSTTFQGPKMRKFFLERHSVPRNSVDAFPGSDSHFFLIRSTRGVTRPPFKRRQPSTSLVYIISCFPFPSSFPTLSPSHPLSPSLARLASLSLSPSLPVSLPLEVGPSNPGMPC